LISNDCSISENASVKVLCKSKIGIWFLWCWFDFACMMWLWKLMVRWSI